MKIINYMLFQEPVKEIKKLADFLDISYTEELLDNIADKCSFDKLKTAEKQPPGFMKAMPELLKKSGKDQNVKGPVIYRKGTRIATTILS